MHFLQYIGSFLMGWGVGANDSANIFGTAVSSRMVNYRVAILLTAFFVMLGAIIDGERGIITLSSELRKETRMSPAGQDESVTLREFRKARRMAVVVSFAAAFTIIVMTAMKLPISTSQAVVGAIAGIGIVQNSIDYGSLLKIVICWVFTPIGGMIFAFIFFHIFRVVIKSLKLTIFQYDPLMRSLLIICGCYGAYALGANNVANVSAVFVGHDMLTIRQAEIFGGISIAAGILTYAKPVMMTVGSQIVKLDAFAAFVSVLANAVTIHIYAMIGVPVSSTQAIIGAILGIGLIKGGQTVNFKTLAHISIAWIATPFAAAILALILNFIANLHYIQE